MLRIEYGTRTLPKRICFSGMAAITDSPDTDFLPCVKPAVLNDLSADLDSRVLLKFIADVA